MPLATTHISPTAPFVVHNAGTSSVSFSEGAVDTSARRRLSTISGGGRGWERKLIHKQSRVPHRRLNAVETSTTSSISVASVQFNINGAPSTEVEGGMTSVRLASTDDGSVRACITYDIVHTWHTFLFITRITIFFEVLRAVGGHC